MAVSVNLAGQAGFGISNNSNGSFLSAGISGQIGVGGGPFNMGGVFTNCGISNPEYYALCELPPSINSSQIKYFFNFLCDPHFHLPLKSLFAVVIQPESPWYLLNQLDKVQNHFLSHWNATGRKWQFDNRDSVYFHQTQYHSVIGCIFASDVRLPGEGVTTNRVGVNQGFLNSPIATGRNDITPLGVGFLETSTSFVDLIIRPWSLVLSHHGLVARPTDQSIKATITVFQMDITEECQPQRIRKIWNFYGAAPVTLNADDLSHNDKDMVNKRQVEFVYMDYDVTDLPLYMSDQLLNSRI
jgi:hypothetical protein